MIGNRNCITKRNAMVIVLQCCTFKLKFNCDYVLQMFLDGEDVLVVLLLKIHRILRHTILHSQKEEQSRVHPSRHPSRLHAILGMDGHEIRSRYVVNIASLSSTSHHVM